MVDVEHGDYVVQQGDCLDSIAFEYGHFWETIWQHPTNSELRRLRGNHNVLLPGDCLFIPSIQVETVGCATGQHHRFRRRGVPCRIRIRILRGGQPRARQPFVFDVDGTLHEGTTDSEGMVDIPIPPNADRGWLMVGAAVIDRDVYHFNFGTMDPITELAGVQKRLMNLGYCCNQDGVMSEQTRGAIAAFQGENGQEPTGELDDQTRQRIEDVHSS